MPTILITGANRGIGLALARACAARGDTVIGTARRAGEASELAAVARVETLNVDDPSSITALGARLESVAIDVLINNAGIGSRPARLGDLRAEELLHVFAVNAVGPLLMVQALLGSLRAGTQRKLAHITSLMGSVADNSSGGAYGYRGSKAALNIFSKSLAVDLGGDGFTSVVLNPGWVRTELGGAHATIDADTSAAGMIRVIDGLTAATSGRFFNHDGRELPW